MENINLEKKASKKPELILLAERFRNSISLLEQQIERVEMKINNIHSFHEEPHPVNPIKDDDIDMPETFVIDMHKLATKIEDCLFKLERLNIHLGEVV